MQHFIVMGVSGCGKSTIAAALASRLSAQFIEADEYHGPANIKLMSSGIPLTDEDRWPWLQAVASEVNKKAANTFMSCSALRHSYRDFLSKHIEGSLFFIHLDGPREVLLSRMESRDGHFMPSTLLDSQIATLEQLQSNEDGVVIDLSLSIAEITDLAVNACEKVLK